MSVDDEIHPPVVDRLYVAIRERPVAEEDLPSVQVNLKTAGENIVAFSPGSTQGLMYHYDYYFPPQSRQNDLFGTIGKEMVEIVMGGVSTNCIAYGSAGTGKTHTLFGSSNEYGLIHDTVRELFLRLEEKRNEQDYVVTMRYWEMSRDAVKDNLKEDDPQETTKCSIFRDGFDRLYVSNLTDEAVGNYEEFETLLGKGNINRINRGKQRLARWHGFVQLSLITTDTERGEKCVVRTMTFVHTKGNDRVWQKDIRGDLLKTNSDINVSLTLLNAGVIHSLEYRAKRRKRITSKEGLYQLIKKSESFFMECKFSQMMAQFMCGREASFLIGCVDSLHYGSTIETLESLQLFRQLESACIPIITPSEKGRLLRKLHALESTFGGAEVLNSIYNNSEGRPRTEEEEELLQLRGKVEGWSETVPSLKEESAVHAEGLREKSRKLRGVNTAASSGKQATHGDRKKIYLNPAKSATYEGQWSGGVFDGFGEHIQSNFKYQGEFREGKREGEGTLFIRESNTSPYKRVYEGEWLEGKRDGWGTQWTKEGEVYEGEFVADQRHGNGKLYLPNGDIIEGSFKEGVCSGWAVLIQPNGDWFEGHWVDGQREGPGVWHYAARKQVYKGEWSKNVAVFGCIEDVEEEEGSRTGLIPRVELLDYDEVLSKEREKLNEKRKRDCVLKGKEWTTPS